MNIEKSYYAVSRYFDHWVRVMEIQTRIMEVQDSRINNSKILIISPPTDTGIEILTQANAQGESYLLCHSERIEKIAKDYSNQKNIINLKTCVSQLSELPFDDEYFDVVFANCFFDFCVEDDFDKIISEIRRVLGKKGTLFSVYMDFPSGIINQVWVSLFRAFPWVSQGCHPVDIKPCLSKNSFKLKKDLLISRLGFCMKYIVAEKSGRQVV